MRPSRSFASRLCEPVWCSSILLLFAYPLVQCIAVLHMFVASNRDTFESCTTYTCIFSLSFVLFVFQAQMFIPRCKLAPLRRRREPTDSLPLRHISPRKSKLNSVAAVLGRSGGRRPRASENFSSKSALNKCLRIAAPRVACVNERRAPWPQQQQQQQQQQPQR